MSSVRAEEQGAPAVSGKPEGMIEPDPQGTPMVSGAGQRAWMMSGRQRPPAYR